MIVYDTFSAPITLTSEVARGQEATLYQVRGSAEQVAKLYHTYRPEYEEKLRWMIAHPPARSDHSPGGVAWPQGLLYNAQARFLGFLMPRIHPSLPLSSLWEAVPHSGKTRHHAAYALAQTVAALHAQGYVLGILGASELLALPSGGVVLVDADSYQVRIPQLVGSVFYPAPVGHPAYTPPERQFQAEPADLTPSHDRFALAVLLFQMLREGVHPYEGRWKNRRTTVSLAERIAGGHYPHDGPGMASVAPPPEMLPLDTLHPSLIRLFERCFVEGHHSLRLRPTPTEWAEALAVAERALMLCMRGHYYANHLRACPDCQRANEAAARQARATTPPPTRKIGFEAWVKMFTLLLGFSLGMVVLLGLSTLCRSTY